MNDSGGGRSAVVVGAIAAVALASAVQGADGVAAVSPPHTGVTE